jgi:hypothetical protein
LSGGYKTPQKSHQQKLMARLLKAQIIFTEKPGYAIITEGVHDLSVDMNTSFLFGED